MEEVDHSKPNQNCVNAFDSCLTTIDETFV